jgi:Xaa-Pro aminopeptidase
MRRHYTLVLKGHIAIATLRFPTGTTGGHIDAMARQFLWADGLDYDHGTGHGVGSYLSVHEGPQSISKTGTAAALMPGMILSNEPGYYKPGAYGIRCENLVIVRKIDLAGAEREIMGFETLTFAPWDRTLIDTDLLTPAERAWIDSYHAEVRGRMLPRVDAETAVWLEAATAAL